MRKVFFPSVILILLAGCGPGTPYPAAAPTATVVTATATPPIAITHPELEPITPENVGRLKLLQRIGKGNVYDAALSPDDQTLAVATATGVYLYDAVTWRQMDEIHPSDSKENNPLNWLAIYGIAFSPDGKILALGAGEVLLWDLGAKKISKSILMQIRTESKGGKIYFSPDGKSLVVETSAGYACDGTGANYALYEIASGRLLYSRYVCTHPAMYYFKFIEGGRAFFAGTDYIGGYTIDIVETATGKLLKTVQFGDNFIYDVSPDGGVFALREPGDDLYTGDITGLVNSETGKTTKKIDGGIVYLPKDNRILLRSNNQWQVEENGRTVCTFVDKNFNLRIYEFKSIFRTDGKYLVETLGYEDQVNIWDLSGCRLAQRLSFPGAESVLWAASDSIAFAASGGNVALWHTNGGSLDLIDLTWNGKPIAVHPDHSMVATTDFSNVYFWDAQTYRLISTVFDADHVVFDPAQDWAAAYSEFAIPVDSPRFVDLINLEHGNLMRKFPVPHERIDNVFFDLQGLKLIVSADSYYGRCSALIYDVSSGNLEKSYDICGFPAVYSPQTNTYAAGVFSDQVQLLNLEDGHSSLIPTGQIQTGNDHAYSSNVPQHMYFSPNGDILVTCNYQNSCRFWDAFSGSFLLELVDDIKAPIVSFDSRGKWIITSGTDGTIRLWGVKKQP